MTRVDPWGRLKPSDKKCAIVARVMMRLFFGLLFFFLVSGPAFGHGLGHQGHGGAAEPAVTHAVDRGADVPGPDRHRHDGSGSFHCAVSASCAPLFLLSGGGALAGTAPIHMSWPIAREAMRRGSVVERDPPVPRA